MDHEPPQSEFLSKDEVRELTGAARAAAQVRWLAEKGIAHRRDGSRVIVSRFHVRQWLEGKTTAPGAGLNWAAVR